MTVKVPKLPDVSASHPTALAAVEFALNFLVELLSRPRYPIPKGGTPLYLQMRRDLPYFIHETKNPDTQILVNRNYKPLGNSSLRAEVWVDYELFTNFHIHLSAEQVQTICAPDGDRSLFGDGVPPWSGKRSANAYLNKLLKLREAIASQ
jgi:hypothetical protein